MFAEESPQEQQLQSPAGVLCQHLLPLLLPYLGGPDFCAPGWVEDLLPLGL